VRAVAQLAPTEASCERAFSAVKFQLGRHRASANPDLVVVTSWCQFEGMEFTESESAESEQDEHVEPPAKAPRTENIEQGEKEKEKAKVPTRTDAETIVQAYVVLHDLARVALPPAVDNRLCAKWRVTSSPLSHPYIARRRNVGAAREQPRFLTETYPSSQSIPRRLATPDVFVAKHAKGGPEDIRRVDLLDLSP
jgi:hypothetical protein